MALFEGAGLLIWVLIHQRNVIKHSRNKKHDKRTNMDLSLSVCPKHMNCADFQLI